MFREGIGVVVEGTFDATQVFKTNRLMINHSNEYRPPKPGEDPEKWKKSMEKTLEQAHELTVRPCMGPARTL